MSAFGPALFVWRTDGKELDEQEQLAVVEAVGKAARKFEVKDDEDDVIVPRRFDYDATEKGALCVLLYGSYAYYGMPEEVMEDQDAAWKALGMKLAEEVETTLPKTYRFDAYPIEV